jgi:hypothetical protein
MRSVKSLVAAIGLAVSAVSCGDVVRTGRSPMLLVIDGLSARRGGGSDITFGNPLLSDVLTIITTPAPCTTTAPCPTIFNDLGQVTLRVIPKDIGTTLAPARVSTNNAVTLSRFRVSYRRADGRNTPGVDVPYPWDSALTGTVPANGALQMGFEIVRHVAKMEAPLVILISDPRIITAIADVTFYGQDIVGNEVSVTGSMQIDFGNFRD